MELDTNDVLENRPRRRGRPRTRGVTTQMNVRVDQDLKVRGDEVLRATGTNPTDVISRLWGYVVRTGTVPDFLTAQEIEEQQNERERLVGAMREVRGMPWRTLEGEAVLQENGYRPVSLDEVRKMSEQGRAVQAREVAQV